MLIGHQDINITADSKHLLSRVPVTNPSARGPLAKLSLNKLSKEHRTIREAGSLHAPPSFLHLWYARNDRPPTSLHGV